MKLIPEPQKIIVKEGSFYPDYQTVIMIHRDCGEEVLIYASMLRDTMAKWCGVEVDIRKGDGRKGDIILRTDDTLAAEAYTLDVSTDGIAIAGGSGAGLLYGVQTLRQLYVLSGGVLASVVIEDYPALPNRGFYHDISRGRIPTLPELKKLVDTMSYYKLNQLQLYVEHTYLFRDFSEVWRDDTPLQAEEILELDRYCRERHIDLVPSLSTFGHMYKMLRTYSFSEYCEMEGAEYRPHSFLKRMLTHTANVSHPGTLPLVKEMIKEYMALFSSRYFNICADETFELCKGRSSHLTKEQDIKDIYTDYVRELCEFVMDNGKIPMFWGDILWGFPEKFKDLPKEGICLNWGYLPDQGELETKTVAETGAIQYTCPGVGGWNQYINLYESAYRNISRLCTYAVKYKAVGVLNTDWGDFGHVNQPEMSRPGMIYGAAFSWNTNIPDFEEINKRISRLEFLDSSEQMLSILARTAGKDTFKWRNTVKYREFHLLGNLAEEIKQQLFDTPTQDWADNNRELANIRRELQECMIHLDSSTRYLQQKYMLGIDAMIVWNEVKPAILKRIYGEGEYTGDYHRLAGRLEAWFMKFKQEWRKTSREGSLYYISEIVFWYADLLRKPLDE
mgnify:CR=1 FL=1